MQLRARGFTLIELLVVIIIFGVLMGAIGLSVAPQTQRRNEVEAQRLRQLFLFAEEEARQTGHPVRWRSPSIAPEAYRFTRHAVSREGEVTWLEIGKRNSEEVLRPRAYESRPAKVWLRTLDQAPTGNAVFRDQAGDEVVIEFAVDEINRPLQLVLQYPESRTVIATDGLGEYKITHEANPS